MGRPTTNPRTVKLNLRISEAESQMIEECSKLTGRPRVDVIVKGVSMVYKELKNK